jgi:hypothetical protein
MLGRMGVLDHFCDAWHWRVFWTSVHGHAQFRTSLSLEPTLQGPEYVLHHTALFTPYCFVSNVGRTSLAVVLQHSQVVLTASPQGSLYCLDEGGPTYAAAAPAISGAGVPAILHSDHAWLEHIGYGTLADLCRQGVLVGERRLQHTCAHEFRSVSCVWKESCVAFYIRLASHQLSANWTAYK